MLYIIPTPIGNLKDITLRALEVLQSVDGIVCEDTRRTAQLLTHYQIKKNLLVLNDYNETKIFPQIIERLKTEENLALVSDAGTPLISDPGYKLIRECIREGIMIDSLPGPSSVVTALTLSGLPPDKFFFLGYPPEKGGQRIKLFQSLCVNLEGCNVNPAPDRCWVNLGTIVMFVSPYKLMRTLEDLQKVFGDIDVVLAHELTKIHQSVESKLISQWLKDLKYPKGEYVLLFRLTPGVQSYSTPGVGT
ncbi:16S rRNA (cytidine(1402)-2'-O)-methyltransferase [Candidatus Daviesbacteria bacterium]|nr:16S rRNA (cytidine(1402)-2'-O)-methyltransferase [Candidatus Daviesbacteria bacterium]